jgi:hypothetical protein
MAKEIIIPNIEIPSCDNHKINRTIRICWNNIAKDFEARYLLSKFRKNTWGFSLMNWFGFFKLFLI